MTFKQYQEAVGYAAQHNRAWRLGQSAFNVLTANRPDLSEQIRGGSLDPFHSDALLPDFYKWVEHNWRAIPKGRTAHENAREPE